MGETKEKAKRQGDAGGSEASGPAECDLVLEGGITSGVAFPLAIVKLANKYRFRNIGGTSVGAIAAAGAAAAEYGRVSGGGQGFARLKTAPDELGRALASLFQPKPGYRRLFRLFELALAKGVGNKIVAPLGAYWVGFTIAVFVWAVLSVPFFLDALAGTGLLFLGCFKPIYLVVLLFLEFLLISAFCVGGFFVWDVFQLTKNDFGLCRGAAAKGSKPALMDWVHEVIQQAAGRPMDQPLTFGQLREKGIVFRAMTTNLSLGVGYALPFAGNDRLFFSAGELDGLLPAAVIDAMKKAGKAVKAGAGEELDDLHAFPEPDDLPVLVAVRMSMSFPLLFSAFPLYRFDKNRRAGRPSRMLFSDGGVTSNFPVRFFDAPVPKRPTFGILLEDLRTEGVVSKNTADDGRVHLPFAVDDGAKQEIAAIEDLPGFVAALFRTARTWQDRKQARIAGFRERVARIYLDKGEGELNLDMKPETIKALAGYGERAADLLDGTPVANAHDRQSFDFADHQWRRFVVVYGEAERLLGDFAERWGAGVGAAIKAAAAGDPTWGKDIADDTRNEMIARFDQLAKCAAHFKTELRHGFPASSRGLRLELAPHDEWPIGNTGERS